MSKRSALILVFIAALAAEAIACVVLLSADTDDDIVALVSILIICIAADTSSRVIMRYGDRSSRR
jgi:hypothetical protein